MMQCDWCGDDIDESNSAETDDGEVLCLPCYGWYVDDNAMLGLTTGDDTLENV